MGRQRSGSIVNIASIAGLHGFVGLPHYSASKGGVLGLTRSLAKEVVGQGIRVNAIAPGGVDTPMIDPFSPAQRNATIAATPIGRLATPDEIAAAVAFAASDDASYLVGETINVSGGFLTV
jgi:3-oxoacyl-[acyl-carrier protein] reductase